MKLLGGSSVCSGSGLNIVKEAEPNALTSRMYPCTVFVSALRNTANAAAIIFECAAIHRIFARCGLAKIAAPIIERIAVNMVAFLSIFKTEKQSVHEDVGAIIKTPSRIKAVVAGESGRIPIPLIQPLKIGGIYNRILSSCKWNKTVRFVLRLGDAVSANTVSLTHSVHLHGSMLPAAFYYMAS